MATLSVTPEQERGLQASIGKAFPTASVIRVKDVLGQVSELLTQLGAAIRAAASVTVAAGIAGSHREFGAQGPGIGQPHHGLRSGLMRRCVHRLDARAVGCLGDQRGGKSVGPLTR